ncbi:MAG: hypothetical protein K8S56_07505 [Candidatus Cloacimonetes bacterium]|nr:hypothetical protein [Candidatus Cloacimonadota bacterium]
MINSLLPSAENYPETRSRIIRVIRIISLTLLLALLTLPINFPKAIGWICGAVAGIIYIVWLTRDTEQIVNIATVSGKTKAIKGFYLRLVFLIIWSVLVVYLIKPDILIYGVGLLSAQAVLFLDAFRFAGKENETRGENDKEKG